MPKAKTAKTLQPVDDNVKRDVGTPGTKMRHLKEELQTKETENEALRGNIDELTKVIGKLDFIKDNASVSVAPSTKDDKKAKDKKAPVATAKTAYKFFCDSSKKQETMQTWKECAPDIRQKYQLLAKADKDRYTSEMDAYNGEKQALEVYYEKKKQEQAMAFYEAHLEAQAALEKAEDESGKKKKKAPKDPDAPKRCVSSYMFFAQEMRPSVVEKNKDAKVTEISKILGADWKALDEKKKKKFEDMAAEDRDRYNEAKVVYEAKVAERKQGEERDADARLEQDKKEAMELMESQSVVKLINVNGEGDNVSVISDLSGSKPAQKKKKDPNAPKRALTAYNYFMKENREPIKSKLGETTNNSELLTEIGKQWKALSETKKKKYNKMSSKDQERYAKDMEQYNATKK